MINFIEPNEAAIKIIAADLRKADAEEIWASHHHTPLQALMEGWRISDFSTIVTYDAIPVAMFGLVVRSQITGGGVPWLLASEMALQCKREFLIQSPPVIQEMLSICPRLSNFVHDKNRVSIKWLKWLGFTIEEPQPFGPDDELFHRFHLEREDV